MGLVLSMMLHLLKKTNEVVDLTALSEKDMDYVLKKYFHQLCRIGNLVEAPTPPPPIAQIFSFLPINKTDQERKEALQRRGYLEMRSVMLIPPEVERMAKILGQESGFAVQLTALLGELFEPEVKKPHLALSKLLFDKYTRFFNHKLRQFSDGDTKFEHYYPFCDEDCANAGWVNCHAIQTDIFGMGYLTIYVFFSECVVTCWPGSHIRFRQFYMKSCWPESWPDAQTTNMSDIEPFTRTMSPFGALIIQSDMLHHISPWLTNNNCYRSGGYAMFSHSVKSIATKRRTRDNILPDVIAK